MKTPVILKEMPDAGVGKDKGLPAVSCSLSLVFALC